MGRHSRHAVPPAPPQAPGGHRGTRRHHPVRTGLLASSAAMAVGAVATSSGMLTGLSSQLSDTLHYAEGDPTGTQAEGTDVASAGSDSPSPLGGTTTAAPDPSATGGGAPSTGHPGRTAPASTSPGGARTTAKPAPTATRTAAPAPTPTRTTAAPTTPVVTTPPAPTALPTTPPASASVIQAARAQILSLVNQQRATAGCKPLSASSSLDGLAQAFSDDMAARGFFDHTDPDGKTPWDRAKALGISNLGGENIARGQADAQAVMDAWMNSPGHRANILNCDYTTLGVGIHYGPDGPWWTQDFGF